MKFAAGAKTNGTKKRNALRKKTREMNANAKSLSEYWEVGWRPRRGL